MSQFFEFVLLGLTTGGAYALVALGLVAVHRGTGVVNFAQGAIGMTSAYVFWKLFAHAGVPLAPAILVGLATGAAISVLFYAFVGRRLVGASTTTKTLVTLGLLLMLQAIVRIIWTNQQERVDSFLVSGGTEILGARIQYLAIVLVVVAVLVTVALTLLFERTRFGRVTTALQDSPTGAQALGYSPHPWGAAAWAISGTLAALGGILLSPVTALSPTSLSTLVIPALGAALIASFRHFWIALVVALLAGIAESLAIGYSVEPGLGKSIPYIVTLIALVVAGRNLPGRGTVDAPRLFRVGSGRVSPIGLVLVVAAIAIATGTLADEWSDTLAVTAIFALIGLSVTVSAGYAGQVNLLPLGLAGLSMLLAGWVSQHGAPLWATLAISVAAAGAAGLLIGIPSVRLRGVGLTIATLAIAAILETWVFTTDRFLNGTDGWMVSKMSILGFSFDNALHPQRFTLLAWGLVIVAALSIATLRRGRAGRRLLATRSDERAAAASGVSVGTAKIVAVAFAAGLAGLAGALLAVQSGSVGGQRFGEGFLYSDSLAIIGMTVLAGSGYVVGGVLAGVFAPGGLLAAVLSFGPAVNDWLALILGLNLVVVLISEPDGVVAQVLRGVALIPDRVRDPVGRVLRRIERRRPAPPTPARADAVAALQPREHAGVGPDADADAVALRVGGLTVHYGAVAAVDHVDLEVRAGTVVGVLGPNGAGKSSLIDAITGFAASTSGAVLVRGEDVAERPPHLRVRRGLTRTFQDHLLFEDLTVRENLQTAADPDDTLAYVTGPLRSGGGTEDPVVAAAAEITGVTPYLDTLVESLSLGWHARVTLARALAARPTVLCLDEPAAALSPEARGHVAATIRTAARELGIAVLLVEHNIDVVLDTCDEVVVMDAGRVIARGEPATVLRLPEVRRAYLGEPLEGEEDVETAPPAHLRTPQEVTP